MVLTRILGASLLVASLAAIGPSVAAQEDVPHPARIQSGTCAGDGTLVAALSDVSGAYLVDGVPSAGEPSGLESALPLVASVTTIPVALADLVATDHSLVVVRSASDPAVVACGDIGGRTLGGPQDLPISLGPVDGSGITGVATLHDTGTGTTVVTVYLVSSGGPVVGPSLAPSLAPTATTVTLGSSLYYGGFDITVEDVTHDPVAATLAIDATFHNTATAPMYLNALEGGQAWVSWDQTVLGLTPPNAAVPPDTTVRGTITGSSIPAEFVMNDAVLTFGLPGDHQAMLPLVEGAVATFDEPIALDVAKAVRAKRYATFKVTGAEIVPARCSGNSDEFVLTPAPANEATLLVTATVVGGKAIGVGGLSLGGAFATGPDGVTGVNPLLVPVLGVREVIRDMHYCFPIGAPAAGTYKVTFLTDPAKAVLKVEVP